ncbi:MAG: ribonuclease Z [Nanoarchaeota archaeon]|nr:ribonuclease Z [Nanoarchaeota archaeon]
MKLVFLGTSSMVPTKSRNHTSMILFYKDQGIMVDCGEGTQKQLRKANISPTKITKLLITHWHGDHILGIPGLIQSLGANQYSKTLEIYGPKGTREFFQNMRKSFYFPLRINLKITEIEKGVFFKNNDFQLESMPMNHDVPCVAYSFREKDKLKINTEYTRQFGLEQHPLLGKLQKGKDITYKGNKIRVQDATIGKKGEKITFILDTSNCSNALKLAKNSDLLVAEATWEHNRKEKEDHDYKHLSAREAAQLAKISGSKKLILTHFSQRYKTTDGILKEAKKIFQNTTAAKDLMAVEV